jgi:hypothetical protein
VPVTDGAPVDVAFTVVVFFMSFVALDGTATLAQTVVDAPGARVVAAVVSGLVQSDAKNAVVHAPVEDIV